MRGGRTPLLRTYRTDALGRNFIRRFKFRMLFDPLFVRLCGSFLCCFKPENHKISDQCHYSLNHKQRDFEAGGCLHCLF